MQIDFYADLICPWCHLGWRRLHAALAQRPQLSFVVHWKPYQLNPDVPVTGIDRQEYLLRKFGNAERVREVLHAVESALRSEGMDVNLHRIKTTSNTYLGHRLMMLAQELGKTDTLLNEFFVAYFIQGQDIGDPHILKALADKAGLPAASAHELLSSHAPHPGIQRSEQLARQLNIRAVPYVLFDGKYSIAGAHDPVAFVPLIELSQMGV